MNRHASNVPARWCAGPRKTPPVSMNPPWPPRKVVAYMEAEWSRDPIRDRYDWLYRYDVNTAEI